MTNELPKISIIVAVYNAEGYLKRCIDSLLAQTFTDFEILLIDDGSTDKSADICDNYAAEDCRLRVFHNENRGIGSTRHFGILHAQGEYTIHVDSDDWVEPDMLESLYAEATRNNADMVICDYFEDTGNNSKYVEQRLKSLDNQDVILGLLTTLYGSCWNKLIRLACYKQYSINFIEGLNYGEDLLVLVRLVSNPIKVHYLPSAFYHYDRTINENSYTQTMTKEMFMYRETFIGYLYEYVKGEAFQPYITSKLITLAYLAIRYDVYSADEFYLKYARISNYPIITDHTHIRPERIFVWIALHLGYSVARTLMNLKLKYRAIKSFFLENS